MRVLLATFQEKTFFYHLVPLAWALRTAGHEVRVASQPKFAEVITQAGLTAVPVGHDRDFWRITTSKPGGMAAVRAGIMRPYDAFDDPAKATWEYLRPGLAEAVWGWHRTSNFPVVEDLVAFARSWQPDLVIWEPLSQAGAIAAKACGAAHARLLWSIDIFGQVRRLYRRLNAQQPPEQRADPFEDWLGAYGRKYGFDFTEDMTTGHFTIDPLPASLRVDGDLEYLPMQYLPYGGPAVVPRWLRSPPERPRVALTMGLSATEIFDGYAASLPELIDALADLDIELVATVPESEQRKLPRIPDNARLVPYVPLLALAPTCSAVVHHAGFGTLTTFAREGVPQLTLPYHFDEPIFARKLTEQGAGADIHCSLATGNAVREKLRQLLTEPGFRSAAAPLRDEIRAMPLPAEVVPRLEKLTTEHR
ncbi:activator-dependent family glycosyltransferase [Amycolatopsis lurida]